MEYLKGLKKFHIEEPTVVTIGKFDGRHRGHQKLLREMMRLKRERGLKAAVFTFSRIPGSVVTGEKKTAISTNEERRRNMEEAGVDYLIEYPFTEQVAHMSPEDFVEKVLVGEMNARIVVAGPDCSFGYRGAGDAALLRKMGPELGFETVIIEKAQEDHRDISSTYIREELDQGNVAKANELLGQPYAIHGTVVHGNHIGGSVLGFPTANIQPPPIKRLPRFGVYVSRVLVDGCYYRGVTNIGKKPTIHGDYPAGAETYIFGLEENLYGKWIEVQLLEFDRGEQKFPDLETLRAAIEKDKEFAAAYYERHPEIYLGPVKRM